MVMISDDFEAPMWRGFLVIWTVLFLTFAIYLAADRNYHDLLLACLIRYLYFLFLYLQRRHLL